jgi:chromosomal replication initiation ATPase DnaA
MTLVEIAHARIERARAELTSANAFLRLVSLPEMRPEAKAAVDFVAERYSVTVADLCGPLRVARISEPRFVAMYLMRYIHGIPPAEIGYCFRRDRTTVEQSLQTVSNRRQTEKEFRGKLSAMVTAYQPSVANTYK